MAIEPIIPTTADILRPAIETLVSLRPNALTAINGGQGVYSHLMEGWRAQASRAIQRLTSGAAASRLPTASGDELRQLLSSEYSSLTDEGPFKAFGDVFLHTGTPTTVNGVIKKGTKFFRPEVKTPDFVNNLFFPLKASTYEAMHDTFVPLGSSTASVRLRAVDAGSAANTPITTNLAHPFGLVATEALFDPNLVPSTFMSAGGHDGTSDDVLRKFATSYYNGQYAPNKAALIAGIYSMGVRHFQIMEDGAGVTWVYIADDSWASGASWALNVQQRLYDEGWVGFGCSVAVQLVANVVINVSADVELRSGNDLMDTSAIDASIQKALRGYFDDRNGWNLWKTNAIKSVIAKSNKKIASCSGVTVKNAVTNATLSGPTVPSQAFTLVGHYYLQDNAFSGTYTVSQ